ncbi:WD-repeat containing protein slp1 [Coccidioides immitis H538.4]|uniref:WD-repeat containing protein slp1 n=1 Tax=Coccidioides immitis H538.4 TaxID=396776 RepID=A0A0J8RDA6_COCIT|nr:WD-repeat containing protein slp1 [Coccidioides immitis H538.4]
MAAVAVTTPVKSHHGIFSSKTAGGRMPLTPSPRQRTTSLTSNVSNDSSPFTPPEAPKSFYNGNLSTHFARARSYRDSPKSNIAKGQNSPRPLELGTSKWTLTGTGHSGQTPKKRTKKGTNLRPRTTKTTIHLPHNAADRFIPNRSSEGLVTTGTAKADDQQRPKPSGSDGSSVLANAASAFNMGSHEDDLAEALQGLDLEDNDTNSTYSRPAPDVVAYKSSLADACDIPLNTRILAFKPPAPESSKPIDLRSQYNRPLKPAHAQSAQFRRRVQTAPERVLDAPGLVDDYYLNLLDWSSGNQVAIGLERNVYVWSADSGSVNCLLETSPDTYISSVKWSNDGAYVGVGLGTGEVQIWDVEEGTKLRICGLEWRSDGAQLATGGNDNLVSIWDSRSLSAPKFTKTNHRAAVKALSWCPWQLNLLATGGGSYDRHIHFWNTTTGARTNSIDTGSQVTSLRWSNHYRELVSSSGFPDNSLSIWSYPTLVRNVEIPAHETRVLHSCLSPDGQMLATAAADESLKFWKIFERKPGTAASASREGGVGSKGKQMTIR